MVTGEFVEHQGKKHIAQWLTTASGQAHRGNFAWHKLAHNLQLLWFQIIIAKLLSGWNDNLLTGVSLGVIVSTSCHDYNYHAIRLSSHDSWYLIGSARDLGRANENLFRVTRPSLLPHSTPAFCPAPLSHPFNIVRWKVWPARLMRQCWDSLFF